MAIITEQHESAPPPIQQTLHGYAEGHRLLASSVKLPKDAERLVLVLSDLSGSTGGEQFDSYLTGYPVVSGGYYAFARTWPAQEMPRPGCVWTHTLLIHEELLSGLIRPEQLLPLFRRPTGSDLGNYQGSIPVPKDFGDQWTWPEKSTRVEPATVEELVRAMYSSSDPRTVLAVPRYAVADQPLLMIWRLQWGSLRRKFTFCGGSRGPRTLEGEPFILQASLQKDLRRFDRGPAPPKIVTWAGDAENAPEDWVRAAAVACVDPEDNSLPAFLNRIGRELPGHTTLFRPVVKAYVTLGNNKSAAAVARLIDLAADEYPEANMGREFKRTFLSAGNPAELNEITVLQGLGTTKWYEAFDAEDLEVQKRAVALWESPDQAWGLLSNLLSESLNPMAEEIIQGLVTAYPLTFLDRILDAPLDVFASVIRRNPKLAVAPEFWATRPDYQARAASALVECREAVTPLANEIIKVALGIAADPISPSLVDVFGGSSVQLVLNWVDADAAHASHLPKGWRAELSNNRAYIIEWLNTNSSARLETIELLIDLIGDDMLASDPSVIAAFANHTQQSTVTSHAEVSRLCGRLLRVAFISELPVAIELATASLDPVYHAAAEARLPDDVWGQISPLLPDGYWWTWDRCYRLRVGIAEKFRSRQWPAEKLTDVTRDDDIFRGVVNELKERRSGRRVLAEAAQTTGSDYRRNLMADH